MPRTSRTSRSQAKVVVNVNTDENVDTQSATNHLQVGKKRTFNSQNESSTSTPTAAQATSEPRQTKRARIAGPARARPLQLSMGDGDVEDQRGLAEVNNNKGKRPPPLTRTASFYPGREVFVETVLSHLPSRVHHEDENLPDFNDGDTDLESVDDWCAEPQAMEPTGGATSKAMLVERPIWQSSSPAMGSATANYGTITADDDVATSQEGSGSSDAPVEPVTAPVPSQGSWPADTELLLVPGSNKIMLTVQRPLIRAVFHDTLDRTRAAMMFQNAFPNAYDTVEMITDSIIRAAETVNQATNIFNRLVMDSDYKSDMIRLPRARVPIFRREVMDRCVAIIQAEFLAIGSKKSISKVAEKQMSSYNYTFPRVSNDNVLNYLPRRTRPYRNIRIINVIRDHFFAGGNRSFARRYDTEFPTHQGRDGVVSREVPIPMVALVATALYAAIKEWHTGEQKNIDFSANTYLDVYLGNINTFNHIRDNREEAFHVMMADIYTQASSAGIVSSAATPIAEIELDDMEA